MNIARLLNLDLVVQERTTGAPDGMGDPSNVADGAPVTYKGWLWQDAASDDTTNENTESEQYRFALEARAAGHIGAGDTITHDSTTYEVFGPTWPATNPRTTVVEYVYGTLRRTA